MKYGVCTNQPSLCRRAAARDLMSMPVPDTRCPEPGCGKPLLPAPGGGTTPKRSPSMLVIAIASILAVVGAGGYFLYQRNQSPDETTVTTPVTPATQPAMVSPAPKPSQQPVVETSLVKATKAPTAPDNVAPVPTPAVTIAPVSTKSEHRPIDEKRKSVDRCGQVDWAAASCDTIGQCWQPESPSLSSCEGLNPRACSHIKICLGVAPDGAGPGVKN